MTLELKIGCDPEVFVFDTETNNFICADGIVDGDKKNPLKIPHGALQVDGTALEFNIDPAKTKRQFVGHIQSVYNRLNRIVKDTNKKYTLVPTPYVVFNKEDFAKFPTRSKILGCDPDTNVYNCIVYNKRNFESKPERTGSGHIHIGWTNNERIDSVGHLTICKELTRQLDYFVGYPTHFLGNVVDDTKRKRVYGQAGTFRPKHYGLEYRVPSNNWLKNKKFIEYVYDQTVLAVMEYHQGTYVPENRKTKHISIEYYINGGMRIPDYYSIFKINNPPVFGSL